MSSLNAVWGKGAFLILLHSKFGASPALATAAVLANHNNQTFAAVRDLRNGLSSWIRNIRETRRHYVDCDGEPTFYTLQCDVVSEREAMANYLRYLPPPLVIDPPFAYLKEEEVVAARATYCAIRDGNHPLIGQQAGMLPWHERFAAQPFLTTAALIGALEHPEEKRPPNFQDVLWKNWTEFTTLREQIREAVQRFAVTCPQDATFLNLRCNELVDRGSAVADYLGYLPPALVPDHSVLEPLGSAVSAVYQGRFLEELKARTSQLLPDKDLGS